MKNEAKSITLEINGEKHVGILSLDSFSFSDALEFCESKGLKMPSGFSTISEAHENGGKKRIFFRHKKEIRIQLMAQCVNQRRSHFR